VYALDALTGSFKWSQPIGPTIGLGYSSSPAAANSVIYVGSGSGTIYALDAFTGATVWSFDTGSPIISSPTVAMRRLFVANWAGELYCFQSSIGEPGLASGGGESGQPIELLPKAYGLMPPIPNPFTSTASLTYAIPEPGHPTLSVYDLTGKLVRTLVDEEREAGWHTATWDGSDRYGTAVAGGVYFLRLTAGGYTFTQKAVLVR